MSWLLNGVPTLVAAAVAAVASIGSILLNRRSTRDIETSKWRRDVERELAGRALLHIVDAQKLFGAAGVELRWSRSVEDADSLDQLNASAENREKGIKLIETVRSIFAELDLIAGPAVLVLTSTILREFEGVVHHLRPGGGADDFYDAYAGHAQGVEDARNRLLEAIRKDLGIEKSKRA
jgi:hypothetical protein